MMMIQQDILLYIKKKTGLHYGVSKMRELGL
jgi:hypothetical protein